METLDRPFTSDGTASNGAANAAGRPVMGDRQVSAASNITQASDPTGKTGKKKRFPMLRKVFGLKD